MGDTETQNLTVSQGTEETIQQQGSDSETEHSVIGVVVEEPSEVTAPTAQLPKAPPQGNRCYELIFLVDASLPNDEVNAVIEKIRAFIESNEGVTDNVRTSDTRRLAYEIKKCTHGIYIVFNFWMKPEFMSDLRHLLRLEERILRHIIIQT